MTIRTSVRARSGRGLVAQNESLGYDADDMFGVRRALEALPASSWEQFLFEWRSLTEAADFDVHALGAAIRRQARRRAHDEGTNDPVAAAWGIVADAIERYVVWRDARTETGNPAFFTATSTVMPASRVS